MASTPSPISAYHRDLPFFHWVTLEYPPSAASYRRICGINKAKPMTYGAVLGLFVAVPTFMMLFAWIIQAICKKGKPFKAGDTVKPRPNYESMRLRSRSRSLIHPPANYRQTQ
jgi:hypothetical protein